MPRAAVVTVAVLTLLPHLVAEAFGVSNDIKIVGQSGGQSQKLPGFYVSGFTHWSVEGGNDISSSPSSRDDLSLVRLPTEGDDTFVNPTSTTELWWPMDLKSLQFRPSLDLLIQSGAPKYAFAGLNVRVPEHASADGGDWRNYGLSSQPLASQWTTFAFAVEGGFRVECFLGKSEDEDQKGEEIEKKAKNSGLSTSDYCRRTALNRELNFRLSDEEIEIYKDLTKYKTNFSRLSNLIKNKDPKTNEYILELAKSIGEHLTKFK